MADPVDMTPTLTATRFAQLQPGELFLCRHGAGATVALVACDPTDENRKLILPLGPRLPAGMASPTLVDDPGTTVVSFGRAFTVRLPTDPEAWQDQEPDAAVTPMVLTGNSLFLRCNCDTRVGVFRPCFVDLGDGRIVVQGVGRPGQFSAPPGIRAYALRWELVTTEPKPRMILAYPVA